jgi:hypothetical protein
LSRDPVGERGGVNLYEAFANAPTIRVDSFGTEVQDGGSQTVWSLPGARGDTHGTFEKKIKCVPRKVRILGIFACCRADLIIAKFLVKAWTPVALYDLSAGYARDDICPRYSDDFIAGSEQISYSDPATLSHQLLDTPKHLPGEHGIAMVLLRYWSVRFHASILPHSLTLLARRSPVHTHLSAGKAISGAVPAIGNEPGRSTLPVVSAVLARAQDIAFFLAFLA